MMLVYRAECGETGCGPFEDLGNDLQEALLYERGVEYNGNVEEYPTPGNDAGLSDAPCEVGLYCGAASFEQWCHWFPGQCQEVLAEAGFVLAIYEVPDEHAFVGDAQVLFRKGQAELVDSFDPRQEPTFQLHLPLAA